MSDVGGAFEEAGFGLVAVVDLDTVRSLVDPPLRAARIDTSVMSRLVMLGQVGSSTWDAAGDAGYDGPDRLDEYSRHAVESVMDRQGLGRTWRQVFPGDALIPLGRLAAHVGWGRPSPLGITIHPIHGPWIAHRFVFVTSAELPTTAHETGPHPCETCADTPCVSACPVGAVDLAHGLDLDGCTSHRAEPRSGCAYQCVAREACPVGVENRYGAEQMRHHYGSGLESIIRLAETSGAARPQPPGSGTNS